ncbi:flagellin N-terminal helical domain-containing protein [Devosia sp. CAU 1758]
MPQERRFCLRNPRKGSAKMADISLSKAVRSNLLSLKSTADMMASTQNRLSTGNKVNSALDNPSSWFTAKGLTNRASDLGSLLDSMANGVKTLEAADNGLSAMTKTLESMQSTLRQARQDKSFQTHSMTMGSFDPNDADLGALVLSGGSVGNPTSVALTKSGTGAQVEMAAAFETPIAARTASLVGDVANDDAAAVAGKTFEITFGDETVSFVLAADAGNTLADWEAMIEETLDNSALSGVVEFSSAGGKFTFETVDNVDGEITVDGGDAAAVMGAVPADPDDPQAGDRVSTAGSDGQYSLTINNREITIESGDTVEDAIDTINAALEGKVDFEAYEATGNKIALRATSADAGTLTIGGDDAALFGTVDAAASLTFARSVDEMVAAVNMTADLEGKVRASNDNGKLRIENLSTQDLEIEGLDANGALNGGVGTAEVSGNSVRAGLAAQFNELRDQLDKLADDATFNGINLLRGDKLSITFNETGTSSIDIQTKDGETVNSSNLGVSTTLEESDLDSDTTIDGELTKLKNALNEVRSQASTFGSNLSIVENRQTFTNAMINTLEDGAGDLTLADMNTEAANLLALQTRQSLSQNSLSLASQADQSILQLIR